MARAAALTTMLSVERKDSDLHVRYRHYLLPATLMILPPLLLYYHGPEIVAGDLARSDLAGLALGIALPLIFAYFFIEFGRFSFSRRDGVFAWHWRNLMRSERGVVALARVVDVRREGYDTRNPLGRQSAYRLVVELDDARIVGLSHGYSGFHQRRLDRIVDEIRDYLEASPGPA